MVVLTNRVVGGNGSVVAMLSIWFWKVFICQDVHTVSHTCTFTKTVA